MTNWEFIKLKASDNDIAQWFSYLFCGSVNLFDDSVYTDFNRRLSAAIWGCMETRSDYNELEYLHFVNTFLSLKYDENKWNEWIENYYKI